MVWFYDATVAQLLASNNKTLAADAGAYAFTGTAATPKHAWITTAGAGSYAFTGQAATLRHAFVTAAGVGAYAFTGQAATLRHAWVTTAAAGSYTFNGSDATLVYTPAAGAFSIVADPGVYAFTGQDATLTHVIIEQARRGGGWLSEEQVEEYYRNRKRRKDALDELETEVARAWRKVHGEEETPPPQPAPAKRATAVIRQAERLAAQLATRQSGTDDFTRETRARITRLKKLAAQVEQQRERLKREMQEEEEAVFMLLAS